ncbi:hypothetical protein OIDMADRAFT_54132 [Oidiodendron maius Zn]|uniref:Uncharacterized protein n=1 Tax=Oidiodendron maius (strain Zn) TaxID=913774 RepID=A0A0C3HFA7_OIDMZ|nr:hypothetical protein OIDMADRAFT_54132 [Oidiodendron maius Zn]
MSAGNRVGPNRVERACPTAVQGGDDTGETACDRADSPSARHQIDGPSPDPSQLSPKKTTLAWARRRNNTLSQTTKSSSSRSNSELLLCHLRAGSEPQIFAFQSPNIPSSVVPRCAM